MFYCPPKIKPGKRFSWTLPYIHLCLSLQMLVQAIMRAVYLQIAKCNYFSLLTAIAAHLPHAIYALSLSKQPDTNYTSLDIPHIVQASTRKNVLNLVTISVRQSATLWVHQQDPRTRSRKTILVPKFNVNSPGFDSPSWCCSCSPCWPVSLLAPPPDGQIMAR